MTLPLVDSEEEAPLSVSELVGLIGDTLASEYRDVLVMGEIAGYSVAASGHRYFTLRDKSAAIDCVMWRTDAFRLAFDPAVGDEIVCRARAGVYAKQGAMQLYVSAMKPVGAGAAQRALEELKRRLAAEGLFDPARRRPLPYLPRTIGVVTSRSGAAIHDIRTTLARRFPAASVVLAPATVQGAQASREIVAALGLLAEYGRCDVVIVGRGGGAAEDLAAFNDESVVRAVAAFPVPTVSAVGHEIDVSLCDLVADHRAATPTAAAEAVVPVHAELLTDAAELRLRVHAAARRYVLRQRDRVTHAGGRLSRPSLRVAEARQTLDRLGLRLERALGRRHAAAEQQARALRRRLVVTGRESAETLAVRVRELGATAERALVARYHDASRRTAELGAKLGALDPLAVLERGYSLVARSDGRLVRSWEEISPGDSVELRFRSGGATAEVTATAAAASEVK